MKMDRRLLVLMCQEVQVKTAAARRIKPAGILPHSFSKKLEAMEGAALCLGPVNPLNGKTLDDHVGVVLLSTLEGNNIAMATHMVPFPDVTLLAESN